MTRRVFLTPLALTLTLTLVSLVARVNSHPLLTNAFWSASAVLLIWQVALYLHCRHSSSERSFQVNIRPQHYLQAGVQLAVFGYWGWYWPPVYDMAWLLLAQLLFAYTFDMLLQWTRRESYVIGFGPFPIIFSTNLFLWFRDDWFYLQFLMIGVGFMGKEFIRWNRHGKLTHIFNPSAFSLGLFSLILIATNTSDLTWGHEIATTLVLAPNIYLFLFLIGLVVMYYFSITLIAASAAAILFALSALYATFTGIPYFLDSEIPAAVFLGLHLLVTDPSTSPKTPMGKGIFGIFYGTGVFVLYALLGALGAPTFYDKLLCVPLLNLSVRRIDSLVHSIQQNRILSGWNLEWPFSRANSLHIACWAILFATMTAIGATDGRHIGDSLPFWQKACSNGQRNACERLLSIETVYCDDNSGWACNELGGHYREALITTANADLEFAYFSRACEVRFQAACINLLETGQVERSNPRIIDLRLLLREKKQNLLNMSEQDLHKRACDHGWNFACN